MLAAPLCEIVSRLLDRPVHITAPAQWEGCGTDMYILVMAAGDAAGRLYRAEWDRDGISGGASERGQHWKQCDELLADPLPGRLACGWVPGC